MTEGQNRDFLQDFQLFLNFFQIGNESTTYPEMSKNQTGRTSA
jgi:hypothetical protein